jgi:restriction system protein
MAELLPSGQQRVFDNRIGWARTYLKMAGLLEYTRRGHFRITQRGLEVLKDSSSKIDVKFLTRYPEFMAFKATRREARRVLTEDEPKQTPRELLEDGYQRIKDELVQDLMSRVKECSPEFFEKMVVELLVKMGYGGSQKVAGKAIGRSGDEGIDGIIKEDKLGLDVIYVQAKRWQGSVGRPEIHKFVGALQGQRAGKVFRGRL